MKYFLTAILTLSLLCACSPAVSPAVPTPLLPGQVRTAALTQIPTSSPETAPMPIETTGSNTYVHDPTMIKQGSTYYVFSTGAGVRIRCSQDMRLWESCGQVFEANPEWVVKAIAGVKDLWAPDIVLYGGKYYLYYSASTFGSNRSAIGLATNTTLDSKSPEYAWVDQGEVISSRKSDNFNAIDPNLTFDKDGQPWLALGSFWSGIKIIKVDPSTFKPAVGAALIGIAAKPGSDAVEGAFITRHGDFYYLFVSHDFCCKGAASTYNIRVGRSQEITGPYLDQDGSPLAQGGGTLLLKGEGDWRGPGHNSIFIEGQRTYMVYHAYDASLNGIATLRITQLTWGPDGWPAVSSGQ